MADTLMRLARTLCQGRLVCALEGGYHPSALKHGVATTLCAMLDRPYQDGLGPPHATPGRGEEAVDSTTPGAGDAAASLSSLLATIARYHGLGQQA
jgi:hypothetical protein